MLTHLTPYPSLRRGRFTGVGTCSREKGTTESLDSGLHRNDGGDFFAERWSECDMTETIEFETELTGNQKDHSLTDTQYGPEEEEE